ncbi:argininosuccinate lyase [Croceibacterium mercuriale]|uniref:Argininosuccinate lyase n=1 Tax=Croceibacterium mercuriale TaxID=1572751 RepID=A0A0B2C046_9SPHN|nr:hypothetical protein [Croceibacterium mercuriale]KHL25336.1 argininosuccinate lyase [Croceibacterium mercuriale]
MTRYLLAFTPLLLAACAQQADLTPMAGQRLPPAPYGRVDPPSPRELLQLDPQAAPPRSDELRSRSEERADDPFDLPPPEN